MENFSNLLDRVVKPGFCVGCGICVGVCPCDVIRMRWNDLGCWEPVAVAECIACGRCWNSCPFSSGVARSVDAVARSVFGSDGALQHKLETGYYLESFVGGLRDDSVRMMRSSGGVCSWLLAKLLREKFVDAVICVVPGSEPNVPFVYGVIESEKDVWRASRSAYFPVEISQPLRQIRELSLRVAVVGLPCVIRGLRKADQQGYLAPGKILYYIGLTCGQQQSSHFTHYASWLAGVNLTDQKEVSFKGKRRGMVVRDSVFSATHSLTEHQRQISWTQGLCSIWHDAYFRIDACNYCDDIFSECADVAFMDAWLPEYEKDEKGTNLVLLRTKVLLDMLCGEEESLDLEPISIAKVIESQRGVIGRKRRDTALNARLARWFGRHCLVELRINEKPRRPILACIHLLFDEICRRSGRRLFAKLLPSGHTNLSAYNKKVRFRIATIRRVESIVFWSMSLVRTGIWNVRIWYNRSAR